jgi:flagellar basal-body rod modification protein FlgD
MQTGMIADTTSTTSTTSSSTTPSNTLDKDAFLQLLVTQLQNQDPTNAQDPNQMVSQMAQFSTLEQQENTNTLLTSMQNQVSALFQGQSASLIGKTVQVTSNAMTLSGGKGSVGISLPSAAANVAVTIKDSTGKTVATLKQGAMAAGDQVVTWNGQDANGNQLADGTYTVSVAATDASGNAVAATTTSFATVTAVSFTNGTLTVTAGGQQYPLSAVNEIAS